jgi:hypothetical protein
LDGCIWFLLCSYIKAQNWAAASNELQSMSWFFELLFLIDFSWHFYLMNLYNHVLVCVHLQPLRRGAAKSARVARAMLASLPMVAKL